MAPMEVKHRAVPMHDLRIEYAVLKDEIDAAIQRVIASGNFVMGEEMEAFEEEFARWHWVRWVGLSYQQTKASPLITHQAVLAG